MKGIDKDDNSRIDTITRDKNKFRVHPKDPTKVIKSLGYYNAEAEFYKKVFNNKKN